VCSSDLQQYQQLKKELQGLQQTFDSTRTPKPNNQCPSKIDNKTQTSTQKPSTGKAKSEIERLKKMLDVVSKGITADI
jgi:small-conductance mechanosensitive channel